MKKLRIVTNNPVYGYKGTLFQKQDNLLRDIDHEVEDELADELLATKDSPFREVDEDGEVIPSKSDVAKAKADAAQLAARTTTRVSPPDRDGDGKPGGSLKGNETVPEAKGPKKIVIGGKGSKAAKDAAAAEAAAAETKTEETTDEAAAEDAKDETVQDEQAADPTTDGAVEA